MKKKALKEGDLVLVDWDDSCGKSAWTNKEDAYRDAEVPQGMPCQTAGWVLRKTMKSLTLHGSRSKHSLADQTSIPLVCVTRIVHLAPRGGK